MEHGHRTETTIDDGARPLVYGAGVMGIMALALGVLTATQGQWFASAMAFVGGIVLVGGMVLEMRTRS